ncbi:response regulator transcription factor [Petroclostridium sp. X23]|uniref:response regulator transcription factor n=1 Tax=Petroclostridium sp. X23 TaxID=3045146 RepID=UPI0024AD0992|nr:response regulator transcription factor [Petroclostridium sp. X23]WHH58746.1 response regulator transcription factor [Petroclostridium sp. X23]
MFQVYLVENDRNLNHLLSLYMQKEGWTITSFMNGENACKNMEKCPHIWIVDSHLPDMDGYQILNEVKETYPQVPFLLISDRNSTMDRVIGLEMGCDDYLAKPFLPKELVIRARKMMELTYGSVRTTRKKTEYHIPPYVVDEMKRVVRMGTTIIRLTSKEFDLLYLFIKNPLRIFSREQIIKNIWGQDHFGSDRSVDDLIRRLRKKMKLLRIETVYGYGYRMLQSIYSDQQRKNTIESNSTITI